MREEVTEALDLLAQTCANSPILERSVSAILWFGSSASGPNFSDDSDLDLQVILRHLEREVVAELRSALAKLPLPVDLSVVRHSDYDWSKISETFQDGTKGLFFMRTLAAATTVFGKNPYPDLLIALDSHRERRSIAFTIRDYRTRLRAMSLIPRSSDRFAKYTLKLIVDLLLIRSIAVNVSGPERQIVEVAVNQQILPASFLRLFDLGFADRSQTVLELEPAIETVLSGLY
jgi:predicted nucleotidyltransferase